MSLAEPLGAAATTVDLDRVAAIAAELELREPNREALEVLIDAINVHLEIDRLPPPFEGVVDVATGVGKTYLLAACLDYMAQGGIRNFAVIAPGATIRDKTVANFTEGHPKNLLSGMETRPLVITSDNFDTAEVAARMEDPHEVKLYVFTVQALTKPTSKAGKRTHDFRESLGSAFYTRLQDAADLVVFADEHHAYFGQAFSRAVRDLYPNVLVGLTATPHRKTPEHQIVFRYPLAAAIGDKLVKTPVLVGRTDDRSDAHTKLLDGATLLRQKEEALRRYCEQHARELVRPVMLVIAQGIEEAEEIEGILDSPDFVDGYFRGRVLTVHSDAPDKALERLDRLEEPDPDGPRAVVSVGMLKEGWDVKNVYVIASLRASVSTILTEQTLGRGLRLPFGAYTGIELLDTLEVLGHERYEELLRRANVLNEEFIDRRTRAARRLNAEGQTVIVAETRQVETPLVAATPGDGSETRVAPGQPAIATVEQQAAKGEENLEQLRQELHPRPELAPLRVPRLRMTAIKVPFSLADITELEPFERFGRQIASDPSGYLRRTTIGAETVVGRDGLRQTRLVTAPAADRVLSPARMVPLEDARADLVESLLGAPVVPMRPAERKAAAPIVNAFLAGLGDRAEEVMSAFRDRAVAGLIERVTEEHRHTVRNPEYGEVVEVVDLAPIRTARASKTRDRTGAVKRGLAFEGYAKSLYAQDWFDSRPERDLANILDDADEIAFWIRLQTGDLPILWHGAGRDYNPDFVAVERDGRRFIVEVKSDRDMTDEQVVGKREAARRWANHVNASDKATVTWSYLLASENHIATAKGSWPALKKLAA